MIKSMKKYSILVLLAMAVLTSCIDKNAKKNNYPVPGVDFNLPIGRVYTIDTLLYMWHAEGTHTFNEDASVYGIVIGDEASGNIYKASFIQDGDDAIELYLKSTSGLRNGDSIRGLPERRHIVGIQRHASDSGPRSEYYHHFGKQQTHRPC